MDEALLAELVKLLRSNPGEVDRLLTAHSPGPDGRCRVCRESDQTGFQQSPCTLLMAARRAKRR